MRTPHGFSLARLAALFCLFLPCSTGYGELPPGSYKELKDKAPEVLKVKVLKVEPQPKSLNYMIVLFTVRVIEVKRSKTGLKPDQEICIRSYHYKNPPPGPANPPLLAKGWRGTVYLYTPKDQPDAKATEYRIAAYGRSFEEDKPSTP